MLRPGEGRLEKRPIPQSCGPAIVGEHEIMQGEAFVERQPMRLLHPRNVNWETTEHTEITEKLNFVPNRSAK